MAIPSRVFLDTNVYIVALEFKIIDRHGDVGFQASNQPTRRAIALYSQIL
ncbi:MAG: hypothetical protein RIG63_01600 [Coleofasciculus chthonoplastes F3-SA18-01]